MKINENRKEKKNRNSYLIKSLLTHIRAAIGRFESEGVGDSHIPEYHSS